MNVDVFGLRVATGATAYHLAGSQFACSGHIEPDGTFWFDLTVDVGWEVVGFFF